MKASILALLSLCSLSYALYRCPLQSYESACVLENIDPIVLLNGAFTVPACDAPVPRGNLAVPPSSVPVKNPGAITSGNIYTLAMYDADYLGQGRGRDYLMWVVSNIPVEMNALKLESGSTISAYRPPNFQFNSGIHRVVLLVFQQTTNSSLISTPISDQDQFSLKLANWLQRNRDLVSCTPIGGFQVRAT